tara:strand:+ start:2945 stop:3304 length:360 start_codon:yes stop_codon:yes gene_type:complete
MSREYRRIIAGSKQKSNTVSIKQHVTRTRAHNKRFTGLGKLVWVLNTQIEDATLQYNKAVAKQEGVPYDERGLLPQYTEEEKVQLRKAYEILNNVFLKENYNEQTQILIQKVYDYDSSK